MNHSVKILPSGHTFTVEHGETILDAAIHHGISLSYGCRSGICGTCIGTVVEGDYFYDEEPRGLSDVDKASNKALFCQAKPKSNLTIEAHEIEGVKEVDIRRLRCKVASLEKLSHDVIRLYLKLPENERLQFFAGQYLDILQEENIRRSFSIANAPHDDEFIELHIRNVDGGEYTNHIFNEMKEKEILKIEAPLGTFFLRENSEKPVIMMCGGTGFAPIKGILEHAFYVGFEQPIHLFWGVRGKQDLYLPDLPKEWAEKHSNFQFTPVLSEPDPEDNWTGETGFVHKAVLDKYPVLNGYNVYMCGAPAMIEAGKKEFMEHGLPEDQMFSDSFEFNSQLESVEAV